MSNAGPATSLGCSVFVEQGHGALGQAAAVGDLPFVMGLDPGEHRSPLNTALLAAVVGRRRAAGDSV